MRSLWSGLIVSFVITHLNTAVCMHAAGLSYRMSTLWSCGAGLIAALHRATMTKVIEEEGEE